ncbi:MAG TPA: NADH-quinone oxidoreductase subunit L [Pirellulales bacterium]|jgi:NADH-quinone oxidoreductase subunit L|nr:NADH-quinone oxidoreductase subunit L [Pirellulales bacterium]
MFDLDTLMVLVPALPLASAILTPLLGKFVLKEQSHLPTVISLALSCVLSLCILFQVVDLSAPHAPATENELGTGGPPPGSNPRHGQNAPGGQVGFEHVATLWTWASIPDAYAHRLDERIDPKAPDAPAAPAMSNFTIDITLRADPLTSIMLCMVTFISTLVAIYAKGYMHHDPGYWRFFTYVSLFVFSMTMLVSVSNFLLLYVFWEAVGLCSYLLVGFWYQKPEAAAAGKKAFLVNRVGDFGFALGLFLIWTTFGTLNFHDTPAVGGHAGVAGVLGQMRLADPALYQIGGTTALLIALALFIGACGKSAQFPLHVWLPDAMEGPTPVSALIHAATMVTAGVYMVTRCMPLFSLAPTALHVVSIIGCITAVMAGIIGITQNDLKRVLAYSTISQLGFMFIALGTGTLAGAVAGMFHLFTHAFFKALLFLGAGSVMHAMGGVVDMRRFSGLRRIMPITHATFWFGALALSGVIPFAGFWSKDAILAAVHHAGESSSLYQGCYYATVFAALLTSLYTFRAVFLTFFGPTHVPEEAGHHAHESPPSMTMPLIVLAICALVVGAYFELTHKFAHFLVRTPSLAFGPVYGHGLDDAFHANIALVGTVVALVGIGLAAYFYLGDRREIARVTQFMQSGWGLKLYQLSYNKFFLDPIYTFFIVWPLQLLAVVSSLVDQLVIDRIVNWFGIVPRAFGSVLRTLQTGMIQFYALAMVLGMLVLVGSLLVWSMSWQIG